MLGVYVTVPVACFRRGLAREYLETEPLPPPATCYGFLLSLVGETRRNAHAGCRIAPGLLNNPPTSVVLRTVWRVKKTPLGSPGNTRPGPRPVGYRPSPRSTAVAPAPRARPARAAGAGHGPAPPGVLSAPLLPGSGRGDPRRGRPGVRRRAPARRARGRRGGRPHPPRT